CMQGLQLYSF
nr:immunoglobulin light chain junction region [Macaca mulatta]MOX54390.1 immunoglobulin light chain junction region [Macaca mulatta]MOX54865.1 immunoglobulin light chain junction region [Macaca mulatta]MOX54972.1 immunoglobulin light chain junction region [Macaca mulatta]MOX55509.1 immunoglobulin light chain junction region [Macaca mulatta]